MEHTHTYAKQWNKRYCLECDYSEDLQDDGQYAPSQKEEEAEEVIKDVVQQAIRNRARKQSSQESQR